MKEVDNKVIAYCKRCGKDVTASVQMWKTIVCGKCNTIISSDIGIERGRK